MEKHGIRIELPEPFLQEDLEKFQMMMQEKNVDNNTPMAMYRRRVVEAAEASGWVRNDSGKPYEKQHPAVVRWAAQEVIEAVEQAQQLPPE